VSANAPSPRLMRPEDLADLDGGRLLDLMTGLVAMLTLPQSAADHADALVVPIGQGEEWRLTHTIDIWETGRTIRHLLIANGNPTEVTYRDITWITCTVSVFATSTACGSNPSRRPTPRCRPPGSSIRSRTSTSMISHS